MSTSSTDSTFWSARFQRWLDRRIPAQSRHVLSQRSVFIFPTRQGLLFGVIVGLVLIGAINYQNSLVYMLAFVLGAVFVVGILRTYQNLSGVWIEGLGASAGQVGGHATFRVVLGCHVSVRPAVSVGWRTSARIQVDVLPHEPTEVAIAVPLNQRGWLNPGRLLIETFYPLGLLRSWSWVDLAQRTLVYPKPAFAPLPAHQALQPEDGTEVIDRGGTEFHGLREYQVGDSLRSIAWRRYAGTGLLRTKEFVSGSGQELVLDWNTLAGMNDEQRLSTLCGWALTASAQEMAFAVRGPALNVPMGNGPAHIEQVLMRLALWPNGSAGGS